MGERGDRDDSEKRMSDIVSMIEAKAKPKQEMKLQEEEQPPSEGDASQEIKKRDYTKPGPVFGKEGMADRMDEIVRKSAKVAAVAPPPKRSLLELPIAKFAVVAAVVIAIFVGYLIFSPRKAPEFEGDEFRGDLVFDNGEKLEVRMDGFGVRSFEDTGFNGTMTVLGYNRMPTALTVAYQPDKPFVIWGYEAGNGETEIRFKELSSHTVVLNGNRTFSADLDYQVLRGTINVDGKAAGEFMFLSPRPNRDKKD